MRRVLVAGNWKMNLNLATARELVNGIRDGLNRLGAKVDAVDVTICPPAVYLFPMAKVVEGSGICVGAQDVYYEAKGAFTGEISVAMVAETGAKYVILGHSERRHTIGHHEDDQMINRKLRAALAGGLTPILCIGETLTEREAGQTLDVLTFQLTAGLVGAEISSGEKLVIAYEPVWAIGTGKTATAAQAQEAHAHVRSELSRLVGPVGEEIRILYGGSMKPDNAADLLSQSDVDGGLIGGASLKTDAFLGIIEAALVAAV